MRYHSLKSGVWWLTLLQSLGVTLILPVLPLYAHGEGADLPFIGWMVGAYMAANLLFAYPAGWLSDRLGRKTMMTAGFGLFAVASAGFLFSHDPVVFAWLRALEGIGGACFIPAALAYVADRAPDSERGSRIAHLTVAQNLGLILGPALGGAMAGLWGMASPFALTALLCGLGTLVVPFLPTAPPRPRAIAIWRGVRWLPLSGIMGRALAGGFALGLYEAVWSIYMQDLGASTWDVGLSWSLFAMPAIVLAGVAGRVLDRMGGLVPAVAGTLFSSTVVAGYALFPRVEALLVLAVIDGIGFAFAYPAQNALMVAAGPEALRGRVIGLVTATGTAGALIGAIATPRLYLLSPALCFGTAASILALSALWLWVSLGEPAIIRGFALRRKVES